jgi:hypothetical protein
MMKDKLKMIAELMDNLSEEMEYSPDEFDSRLGKKKPVSIEVMEIEAKPDLKSLKEKLMDKESEEEEMPMLPEMGEEEEYENEEEEGKEMMEDPAELRRRLRGLRGMM